MKVTHNVRQGIFENSWEHIEIDGYVKTAQNDKMTQIFIEINIQCIII